MKFEANNCETATRKSQQHEQEEQQQQQQQQEEQQQFPQTANATSCINNNNNSNDDTSQNTAAATATKTTTATYTKMTDERNVNTHTSNNNNNSSNNNNNNSNNNNVVNNSNSNELDIIKNNSNIIEAAKILLKNGLNGTTTSAAATLLTAAAAAAAVAVTANLPPPLPPPPTSLSSTTQSATSATHAPSDLHPAQTPAVVAATSISSSLNNGQSPKSASNPQQRSATTTKSKKAMAAATATAAAATNEFLSTSTTERLISGTSPSSNVAVGGGGGGVSSSNGDDTKIDNGGVIDYTVHGNNSANTLNLTTTSNGSKTKNSSSNDIGRHPISSSGQGFGGRLQFFKDGKFILELARSKDGEKGGWVSVPRKLFRAPLSATSSTITPTSTSSTTYPKNESSTSLSFSDDNSSIQSSPWQRDHCWKQAAPRYGISKEMSLFYKRAKQLTLTTTGLQVSRKKRRRPYDNSLMPMAASLFVQLEQKDSLVQSTEKSSTSERESDCKAGKNDPNENNSEDDACSTSSTSTLTGTDCIDGVITANKSPKTNAEKADNKLPVESVGSQDVVMSNSSESNETAKSKSDSSNKSPVESMNASEGEHAGDVLMAASPSEEKDANSSKHLNGDAEKLDEVTATSPPLTPLTSSLKPALEEADTLNATAGAGDKRLKKFKTRAKLITIIQKLIDRVPTAIHSYMSKTPQHLTTMSANSGGATYNPTNSMMHKISPPSSSSGATSRLVELQYHQQHVSPRKRILREFEKVSLEETGPTAIGGKRCRAKGGQTTTSGAKSSPQRVQSIGCAVPTSSTMSTGATATATNGGGGGLNKQPSKSAAPASTSSTPTRLYSSYSIHSLLGSGSSSSSTASSGKQAIISNINYQQHQQQSQQQHNFADPSYLRAMLASPQSPENNGTGGKSPSNAINKKRSPPYSSPLYDNHSRSPTVSTHINNDYGRRSPRATPPETNYKIRFGAEQMSIATSSANQMQQQQQQHQQQQQQSFYSPYMMSPKYVPAPQTSMSPNSINTARASPSPRHHSSAFSAHIPSLANASASANSIPARELSPPRSATASPRETTPRTVPKKTASIRRQFASPNNVSSPNERTDEHQQHQQQHERKAHSSTNSSGTAHQQQHSYQRASPNPHAAHMSVAAAAAAASPLHYYMYGPNTTGSSNSNALGATSIGSNSAAAQANAAAAAAAAAAAGAYIPAVIPPSYFHPYMSTLAALRHNSMWMHHYPGTTAGVMPPHNPVSSQTASRLASPFHSFPYNGVGPAAVAAAAAAANAFGGGGGGGLPQSHLSQGGLAQQMSAQSAMHHHGPSSGGAYVGGVTHSTKLTEENSINTTATKQTTALSFYPSSIKDEHSSDVPLNLSKH